jgi:hypothetical protein
MPYAPSGSNRNRRRRNEVKMSRHVMSNGKCKNDDK